MQQRVNDPTIVASKCWLNSAMKFNLQYITLTHTQKMFVYIYIYIIVLFGSQLNSFSDNAMAMAEVVESTSKEAEDIFYIVTVHFRQRVTVIAVSIINS